MRARDLAEPYPAVSAEDDAVEAARLLAQHKLPALLVVDSDQRPYAIVPGSQLIKQLVPEYVREDPRLGAGIDDRHLDEVTESMAGLTVAEWLPPRTYLPSTVGPDTGRWRRSWPALTPHWSPSSNATRTRSGWSARSQPPA
ncbi:CBS domain-containing protein [Streptomyces caniferus]|uniref:CBS domain-containing protein n=1 Tax=Streptomyces caniferus TaxID=285557 RepID=UPI0034514948